MNENEVQTFQIRDGSIAVFRGKFIAITSYIKKEERYQIKKLIFKKKKSYSSTLTQ